MRFDMTEWLWVAESGGIMALCTALPALAGLPVLCVVGEALAQARQRSSYDKCARQLAALAMTLAWPLTLGGLWPLWGRLSGGLPAVPGFSETTDAPALQAAASLLIWLTLACGALCLSLYRALWRAMRPYPAAHQALGLLAAALCYLALYGVMSMLSAGEAVARGESFPSTLAVLLFPGEQASLWDVLPFLPCLTLALAGSLGALWLLIRRHRDDYGRDHYAQMLPWCTLWAKWAWTALWLVLAYNVGLDIWSAHLTGGASKHVDIIRYAAYMALWSIPALLWTIVARSASPLRRKLTLVLALALAMFFVLEAYKLLTGA